MAAPLQRLIDSTLKLYERERIKKEMETMDNFIKQLKALFSPTTRRGRAIRTAIQGFIGLLTFLAGLLVLPGLEDHLFNAGIIAQVGVFGVWLGIIAYIQNALEALVKFLWGE